MAATSWASPPDVVGSKSAFVEGKFWVAIQDTTKVKKKISMRNYKKIMGDEKQSKASRLGSASIFIGIISVVVGSTICTFSFSILSILFIFTLGTLPYLNLMFVILGIFALVTIVLIPFISLILGMIGFGIAKKPTMTKQR